MLCLYRCKRRDSGRRDSVKHPRYLLGPGMLQFYLRSGAEDHAQSIRSMHFRRGCFRPLKHAVDDTCMQKGRHCTDLGFPPKPSATSASPGVVCADSKIVFWLLLRVIYIFNVASAMESRSSALISSTDH